MATFMEEVIAKAEADQAQRERVINLANTGDDSTLGGRILSTAISGAGLNLVDEALDLVGFEETADIIRRNRKRLQEENAVTAFAAEAAGTIIPSVIASPISAGANAGRITSAAVGAAREGLLAGATSAGAADGQSFTERLDDAALGAAVGVGAYGALNAVGSAGKTTLNAIRGGSRTAAANDAIKQIAEKIQITPEELTKSIRDGKGVRQIVEERATTLSKSSDFGQQDAENYVNQVIDDLSSTENTVATRNAVVDMGRQASKDSTKALDTLTERLRLDIDHLDTRGSPSIGTSDDPIEEFADLRADRDATGEALGNVRRNQSMMEVGPNGKTYFEEVMKADPEGTQIVREKMQGAVTGYNKLYGGDRPNVVIIDKDARQVLEKSNAAYEKTTNKIGSLEKAVTDLDAELKTARANVKKAQKRSPKTEAGIARKEKALAEATALRDNLTKNQTKLQDSLAKEKSNLAARQSLKQVGKNYNRNARIQPRVTDEEVGLYRLNDEGIYVPADDFTMDHAAVTAQDLRSEAELAFEQGKNKNTQFADRRIEIANKLEERQADLIPAYAEARDPFLRSTARNDIARSIEKAINTNIDQAEEAIINSINDRNTASIRITNPDTGVVEKIAPVSDDEIQDMVERALRRRVTNAIETNSDLVIKPGTRRALMKIGTPEKIEPILQELDQRQAARIIGSELDRLMESTDPRKVAEALNTIANSRDIRKKLIDSGLSPEQVESMMSMIHDTNLFYKTARQLTKLGTFQKMKTPSLMQEFVSGIPASIAILGPTLRGATVAALRAAKNSGGFGRSLGYRNYWKAHDEVVTKMLSGDAPVLGDLITGEFATVFSGNATGPGWVDRAMRRFYSVSALTTASGAAVDEDGNVKPTKEQQALRMGVSADETRKQFEARSQAQGVAPATAPQTASAASAMTPEPADTTDAAPEQSGNSMNIVGQSAQETQNMFIGR